MDTKLFGVDLFNNEIRQSTASLVARQFVYPPFSVLNARDGYWQERKRAWLSLGIKSEVGRLDDLTFGSGLDMGRTSVFDPVLSEIIYRWFCPGGGQIIDPFAGGSVRGVVASFLGLKYWGGELRQEQVEANRKQGRELCQSNTPQWVCGDSAETLSDAPDADFIFSCPPYGNLEKYSDESADLSNMEWHTFLPAYKTIILRACKRLKNNRFACFVVGDFRDDKGFYRNFVSETIQGFLNFGMQLYNEAIMVTSVGSASMRVTKQFQSGRKFAKTHQNVLVFCKGDWRQAAAACNLNKEGTA